MNLAHCFFMFSNAEGYTTLFVESDFFKKRKLLLWPVTSWCLICCWSFKDQSCYSVWTTLSMFLVLKKKKDVEGLKAASDIAPYALHRVSGLISSCLDYVSIWDQLKPRNAQTVARQNTFFCWSARCMDSCQLDVSFLAAYSWDMFPTPDNPRLKGREEGRGGESS